MGLTVTSPTTVKYTVNKGPACSVLLHSPQTIGTETLGFVLLKEQLGQMLLRQCEEAKKKNPDQQVIQHKQLIIS